MVKRCAWGTCKTDSRYPERLIKGGKVINSYPFPSEKKFKQRRELWIRSCSRAGQMTLNVRRIATYAACVLWERTGRPTKIQILFQLQPVEKRCVLLCVYCMSTYYFLFSNLKFI